MLRCVLQVTKFKKGDKVVACFDLGCGQCFYCKRGLWSSCSVTNPSKEQEAMYGNTTAGFHGYSAMTGAYEGGQAQYARVIFGEVQSKLKDGLEWEGSTFVSIGSSEVDALLGKDS
jgi:threonine dehydrogenase-like Zn-dependent dehydrogenase